MKQKTRLKPSEERLMPKYGVGYAYFYEHLARYFFASQFVKDKVVLDAGCGVGYGSYILVKYDKAKKVYAIDNSRKTKLQTSNWNKQTGSIQKQPKDIIVANNNQKQR